MKRGPGTAGRPLALLLLLACGAGPSAPAPATARSGRRVAPPAPVKVLASHPHDPEAFTQGLVWSDGRLFESTGHYGQSTLREVELESGRVVRQVALPAEQFGEGLALAGDRLIQLTWREGVARVWRRSDFAPLGELRYAGEGWGLAFDGRRLIQSDGSATLMARDPETFSPLERIVVRRAGRAVPYLNELEWAAGALYANVWLSDEIVRIDPATGEVSGAWDASGLLGPEERQRADVLNGIAWNPERRTFYLTGKRWPRLFEVELPELAAPAPSGSPAPDPPRR